MSDPTSAPASGVPYFWRFPNASDRALLRGVVPLTGTESPLVIEAAVRAVVWRELALITGVDDPAVFPENDRTVGVRLLTRCRAARSLNSGLGPTISCGTAANLYIAIMAAFGHYARQVIATNARDESDHTAEWFNPVTNRWNHVLPHSNGAFTRRHPTRACSYMDWSSRACMGSVDDWAYVSPTGGKPIHPSFDRFAGWPGFWKNAVVLNGNGVVIDGVSPVTCVQVWRSPQGGAWSDGVNGSASDIYPDLTGRVLAQEGAK